MCACVRAFMRACVFCVIWGGSYNLISFPHLHGFLDPFDFAEVSTPHLPVPCNVFVSTVIVSSFES